MPLTLLPFRSYRARLQAAFLFLGIASIGLTGWEAISNASAALESDNYARLTAVRETKRRQVEDYFRDLHNHVLALSTDESSIAALDQFGAAWRTIPAPLPGSALRDFYRNSFAPSVARELPADELPDRWFPNDPRQIALQQLFLSGNPHPVGKKDRLLRPARGGPYSDIHARYHPTLQRYQAAFGLYDIFLIEASGRILYTVQKEIDLGAQLQSPPYSQTGLAAAFRRAMSLTQPEELVAQDFQPYVASHFSPAAFLAAPIWRAGDKLGVLAIQISIAEINRVVTGSRNWAGEGLGRTGQAFLVGPDQSLRSDLREEIEDPSAFAAALRGSGFDPALRERIERHRTVILNLPASPEVAALQRAGRAGSAPGHGLHGQPVLRSFSPVSAGELAWFLVAEIDTTEVQAPIRTLRRRIVVIGLFITAGLFFAAWWVARSIARPVLDLAAGAVRLGQGTFDSRVNINSSDEIGQLAESFNRMADNLQRTTVSRDSLDHANQQLLLKQAELERLADRLIEAQEEERRRLGRELHDDVTQRIAALAIETGHLRNLAGHDPRLQVGLDRVKQRLVALSDEIHRLSRSLHPSSLDDLGLAAAIEAECRAFFERGGPPVACSFTDPSLDLSPARRLALYRIVQEALRNIERHAAATEVTLELRTQPEGLTLEIRDDGRGYDPARRAHTGGVGLASMEERARLAGGQFTIESAPGRGTRIRVHLPRTEQTIA